MVCILLWFLAVAMQLGVVAKGPLVNCRLLWWASVLMLFDAAMQIGFVAKGVLYAIIGGLACQSAVSDAPTDASPQVGLTAALQSHNSALMNAAQDRVGSGQQLQLRTGMVCWRQLSGPLS